MQQGLLKNDDVHNMQADDVCRKVIKRYLVYDYDITVLVDRFLEESLNQLDYLLRGYTDETSGQTARRQS
jgi:hypothetical protein